MVVILEKCPVHGTAFNARCRGCRHASGKISRRGNPFERFPNTRWTSNVNLSQLLNGHTISDWHDTYVKFPPIPKLPCIHEGPITQPCMKMDGLSPFRSIRDCDIFDSCVRDRRAGAFRSSLHSCHNCKKYNNGKPPALFRLDMHDPIPGPEMRPTAKSPSQITRHREGLIRVLDGSWEYPGLDSGDGIITVGGGKFWPGIVVSLHLLRRSGCKLPVEVWYRGKDEPINPRDVDGLENIRLVDAYEERKLFSCRVLNGWEAKAFALQRTQFRRVLYLDADAYCVNDPTPMFAELDRSPLVFWIDLPNTVHAVHWNEVGIPSYNMPPVQGGQILFDRKECWRELVASFWANQHSDFYYAHLFGDQDIWRAIWTACGSAFHSVGDADWQRYSIREGEPRVAFICAYHGIPMVIHRCQSKMFVGGSRAVCNSLPKESEAWGIFDKVITNLSETR